MNGFPQVVTNKALNVTNTSRGAVEGKLVPGTELGLETILSPKTTETTKIHDSNPGTEMVSLLHSMGGENLERRNGRREREEERGEGGKRENEGTERKRG